MNSPGNVDLEALLDTLPDLVANALEAWRISTLDREKCEALLYAALKGQDDGKSATEIKAAINADSERYNAVLEEIQKECEYQRLYEKLLSTKRRAALRTAF